MFIYLKFIFTYLSFLLLKEFLIFEQISYAVTASSESSSTEETCFYDHKLTLEDLPIEVFKEIIKFLPSEEEVHKLSIVNHFFKMAVSDPDLFKNLMIRPKIMGPFQKDSYLSISKISMRDSQFQAYFKKSVYSQIKAVDLSGLDFNSKCLDLLPDTIEILILSQVSITFDTLSHLKHLKNLKYLSLNNNLEFLSKYSVSFESFDKLEILHLQGNRLNRETLKHLPLSLKILNLVHNQVTDDELIHLSQLSFLTFLDLRGNQLTGQALEHLPRSLKTLDLCANKLGHTELVNFPPLLTKLDLSYNSLKGVKRGSLPRSLIELDLSYNQLGVNDPPDFSSLTVLESLNLSDNQLDHQELGPLPPSLKFLDLSKNSCFIQLKDLVPLTVLTHLNLSGASFLEEKLFNLSAAPLLMSNVLKHLPSSLKTLNLKAISRKNFQELDLEDLPPFLITLDLRENAIKAEKLKHLKEVHSLHLLF